MWFCLDRMLIIWFQFLLFSFKKIFLLCHCDAGKSAQCCRNLPFFSKRYSKKKRQMGEFSLSTKSYLFLLLSSLFCSHFADLRVIKNFSLVRPYLQHRLSLVLFTHQSQESLDIKKITAVAALLHNWFTLNLWESSFLSKKLEINLIYHYKTSN